MQSVIDFTLIAFSIFMVLKVINHLQRKKPEEPAKSEEVVLLTEIRDLLKSVK